MKLSDKYGLNTANFTPSLRNIFYDNMWKWINLSYSNDEFSKIDFLFMNLFDNLKYPMEKTIDEIQG